MINLRLESVRKHLNLTKKDFASKLGITAQAYNNYSKGTRDIPIEIAIKINQLFNISMDWLLVGSGGMFGYKEAEAYPIPVVSDGLDYLLIDPNLYPYLTNNTDLVAMQMPDDTMRGYIREGEWAFAYTHTKHGFGYYIVEIAGQITMRVLEFGEDGTIRASTLYPQLTKTYTTEEIRIIGIVIQVIHNKED